MKSSSSRTSKEAKPRRSGRNKPHEDAAKSKKQRKKKSAFETFEESCSTFDDAIQQHVRSGNQERHNETCELMKEHICIRSICSVEGISPAEKFDTPINTMTAQSPVWKKIETCPTLVEVSSLSDYEKEDLESKHSVKQSRINPGAGLGLFLDSASEMQKVKQKGGKNEHRDKTLGACMLTDVVPNENEKNFVTSYGLKIAVNKHLGFTSDPRKGPIFMGIHCANDANFISGFTNLSKDENNAYFAKTAAMQKSVRINKNCETFIDYDSASHQH